MSANSMVLVLNCVDCYCYPLAQGKNVQPDMDTGRLPTKIHNYLSDQNVTITAGVINGYRELQWQEARSSITFCCPPSTSSFSFQCVAAIIIALIMNSLVYREKEKMKRRDGP